MELKGLLPMDGRPRQRPQALAPPALKQTPPGTPAPPLHCPTPALPDPGIPVLAPDPCVPDPCIPYLAPDPGVPDPCIPYPTPDPGVPDPGL
eukprot:252824-Rhodomonas_salina.1